MTLRNFVSDLDAAKRTITVYTDEPNPQLADQFGEWNVEIEFEQLPPGTVTEFATVRRGDEFLGSVDVGELTSFFEPEGAAPELLNAHDPALTQFLDLLDDTVFRGCNRRQLLAASREFEERAWRVGTGQLHVCFQRPAALDAQRSAYEQLADRGLDVHLYLDGSWDEPSIPGTNLHTAHGSELSQFWLIGFDPTVSAGDAEAQPGRIDQSASLQSCAILAEETAPGSYSGFWTYDPAFVRSLCRYLVETYW